MSVVSPTISIIISTYNSPRLLCRCLEGFRRQNSPDFEIIIADDGSGDETRDLILEFSRSVPMPVVHCWQPDDGFGKTAILNKAVGAASGTYLVFTDGDCIPRNDFISAHRAAATPGRFLSGGVEYLSEAATGAITPEMIDRQEVFQPRWLSRSRERTKLIGKVNANPFLQTAARWLSWTRPTFNGHNSSAFKNDVLAVNGFDERMRYGGLDRELGERLANKGIRAKSVRHDAIMLHQYHSRPYATPSSLKYNRGIRSGVRTNRATWTEWGIDRS